MIVGDELVQNKMMDQHFLDNILRELKTSFEFFFLKTFQSQSIVLSFKTEDVFKLFSWKLSCVALHSDFKTIFLIKLSIPTSARSDVYKISQKLYCGIFTNTIFSFHLSNTESEISAERLIYLNRGRKGIMFLFELGNKCDSRHVCFLKKFKTEQKRKQQYKRHLIIHTRNCVNELEMELQNYYDQLKKWVESKKIWKYRTSLIFFEAAKEDVVFSVSKIELVTLYQKWKSRRKTNNVLKIDRSLSISEKIKKRFRVFSSISKIVRESETKALQISIVNISSEHSPMSNEFVLSTFFLRLFSRSGFAAVFFDVKGGFAMTKQDAHFFFIIFSDVFLSFIQDRTDADISAQTESQIGRNAFFQFSVITAMLPSIKSASKNKIDVFNQFFFVFSFFSFSSVTSIHSILSVRSNGIRYGYEISTATTTINFFVRMAILLKNSRSVLKILIRIEITTIQKTFSQTFFQTMIIRISQSVQFQSVQSQSQPAASSTTAITRSSFRAGSLLSNLIIDSNGWTHYFRSSDINYFAYASSSKRQKKWKHENVFFFKSFRASVMKMHSKWKMHSKKNVYFEIFGAFWRGFRSFFFCN